MQKSLFTFACLLACASWAQAGPIGVEVFDDGVLQGGITVIAGSNGLIFSGTTTHFSLTNGAGTSNNPGTTSANLNLTNNEQISALFGATGGTHTIQIVLSQTDWTAPTGTMLALDSSAGGSIGYTAGLNPLATTDVAATYQGFLDPSNTLFGQPVSGDTPLQSATASLATVGTSSLVFGPQEAVNQVPGAVPFSLTSVLTLTFTEDAGSGQDTANASVTTVAAQNVPEPTSAVLLGVGGAALGLWRLRRRR